MKPAHWLFTLLLLSSASTTSQQLPTPPVSGGAPAGLSSSGEQRQANSDRHLTPAQQKLKTFRTMSVQSDTIYLESYELTQALNKRFEIKAWKIELLGQKDSAEVWVRITRPFFTYDWKYRIIDTATGQELGAGRIVAWDGKRAADAIAADVARTIGRVRSLPLHLLAGLGDESDARKWELTYEKGSEGARQGVRLTVSVSPERIVGRRQSRVVFVIPARSVSGAAYNLRRTDASKATRGWDAFWGNFYGSMPGDDPNAAMVALITIPVVLGVEALLKQVKHEEHFCEIAWVEDGAVRDVVLRGDNREALGDFLGAIGEASHRKAIDMEAETAALRQAIEREDREGHSIPLQLEKKIAVGWKTLEPGAYRIVVVERQPGLSSAYFVSATAGSVRGAPTAIVAQMPVIVESRTSESPESSVRYREDNGLVSLEEIATADKTLRFRAVPLRFAAEPQIPEDIEELLAEAMLRPKYRSIHVRSDTVYLKREALEKALAQHPAFIGWQLTVAQRAEEADLALLVTRPFLTFDWTYALTELKTGRKLVDGKITARDGGRAATLIADQIVNALKANAAQEMKNQTE